MFKEKAMRSRVQGWGRYSIYALLGLLFIPAFSVYAAAWYNASWKYRQKITISSSMADSDLSDFPCLIKITDKGNKLFSNTQPDGDDILFTSSNGTTKLSHEIEKYTSSGTKELDAWVKLSTLSSGSDTIIYMYYGNSSCSSQEDTMNMWDNNYVGVWHMNESSWKCNTIDEVKDSTSNANHGSAIADATTTSGQIGNSGTFDGEWDSVDVPISPALSEIGGTIMAWIMMPDIAKFTVAISLGLSLWRYQWIEIMPYSSKMYFRFGGDEGANQFSITNPMVNNEWIHITMVWNSSTGIAYVNGVKQEGSATVVAGTYSACRIGGGDYQCKIHFPGSIDEVRISNTARSADWIAASYRTQNSSSTYLTFSGQEVP